MAAEAASPAKPGEPAQLSLSNFLAKIALAEFVRMCPTGGPQR
jgi:hypothetical protein